MSEIMSLLDEHKTEIPDGLYLELGKKIQELYKKGVGNNFYEVCLAISHLDSHDESSDIEIERFKLNFQLPTEEAQRIEKDIDKYGSAHVHTFKYFDFYDRFPHQRDSTWLITKISPPLN